jgi:hypothetical protein
VLRIILAVNHRDCFLKGLFDLSWIYWHAVHPIFTSSSSSPSLLSVIWSNSCFANNVAASDVRLGGDERDSQLCRSNSSKTLIVDQQIETYVFP